MSDDHRREQFAGCMAWLRRLWEWLLGLFGKGSWPGQDPARSRSRT